MLVMTYSDARQNFASVLDRSKKDGAVFIKRSDGTVFRLSPEPESGSPFDGVNPVVHLAEGELAAALADIRSDSENRFSGL